MKRKSIRLRTLASRTVGWRYCSAPAVDLITAKIYCSVLTKPLDKTHIL